MARRDASQVSEQFLRVAWSKFRVISGLFRKMIFESHISLRFAAACLVSHFLSSTSPSAFCHSERSREWSNPGERHGRWSREVAARESGTNEFKSLIIFDDSKIRVAYGG